MLIIDDGFSNNILVLVHLKRKYTDWMANKRAPQWRRLSIIHEVGIPIWVLNQPIWLFVLRTFCCLSLTPHGILGPFRLYKYEWITNHKYEASS